MCGICGEAGFDRDQLSAQNIVVSLCRRMRHRGPDDEGVFVEPGVGLGIRRLSIIDLQTGHQPIHNEDTSIWVVLNGEIYNYQELRARLAPLGHQFYTRTDTEVIVHAYEEYGEDCVTHLNGMFAFAVWDRKQKRLLLARDRMGIKPLYYMPVNGGIVFASEAKTLLAHPDMKKEIDLVALNQYLSFEYVPTPLCIFKGVKKLPPGHTLSFHDGNISTSRYWDISLSGQDDGSRMTAEDYEAGFKNALRESVKKELVSDVPIGVLLSGGLDSSAVAATMCELVPGSVNSFTIGFEDPSFDESNHAKLVARHLGTKHHEMILEPRHMWELVSKLGEILDEPHGDSSMIPTYLLSRFTRQHVTVALGGDGGDELLAGYSTLQAHRLASYYGKLPSFVRNRVVPAVVSKLPVSRNNLSFDFKSKRFVAGMPYPPEVRHHVWLGSFTPAEKASLYSPGVLSAISGMDTYDIVAEYLKQCRAGELINRIMYLDMKLYLEGDILTKVDRASMACSLEVRVPLLNHTLVEFVNRLPLDLKLRGMTRKYILRKSMAGRLPPQIIERGKKGFNMPVAKWLKGELKEMVTDVLSEDRIKREGFFDHQYVERLLSDHFAGKKDNRKLLWTLLVFELWHDEYVGRRRA